MHRFAQHDVQIARRRLKSAATMNRTSIAVLLAIESLPAMAANSEVNAVRARAGLGPMVFQDGVPAFGAVIRASHIINLRNALNAALFPNPVYARPALAIGDVVTAVDVQELRNYAR
jgi:hypothetical protein